MISINEKIPTFSVNDYKEFLSLISDLPRRIYNNIRRGDKEDYKLMWFRGISSKEYHLVPSLYRSPVVLDDPGDEPLEDIMRRLIDSFKIEALHMVEYERLHNLYFDKNKYYDFLKIMQHYRAPTNLLDFSVKPNVALYFALEHYFKDYGFVSSNVPAVWILFPIILNKENQDAITDYLQPIGGQENTQRNPESFTLREPSIRYLEEIPILDDFPESQQSNFLNAHCAIRAIYDLKNIKNQSGTFVNFPIHIYKSEIESKVLDCNNQAHHYLVKIFISKPHSFTNQLWDLGDRPWDYLPHLDIVGETIGSNRFCK